MSQDLITTGYKEKNTLVLGKISNIRKEITYAKSELKNKREAYESSCRQLNNTSKIHFIKRRRLKKEVEEKFKELTLANSEALIKNFKILGDVIKLILLTFLIPMDLLQKTGLWVADGFKKRDDITTGIIRKITPILKSSNKKRSNLNILNGILRLLAIILFTGLTIFGIIKIVSYTSKKSEENAIEKSIPPTETTTSVDDTVEQMQSKIDELEKEINELRSLSIPQPSNKEKEDLMNKIILESGAIEDSKDSVNTSQYSSTNDLVTDSPEDKIVTDIESLDSLSGENTNNE